MSTTHHATVGHVIPELEVKLHQFDAKVAELREATSAQQRAILAADLWSFAHSSLLPAIATERRSAVRALRADYSLSAIAEMLGVNDSRIAQIVKGPQ